MNEYAKSKADILTGIGGQVLTILEEHEAGWKEMDREDKASVIPTFERWSCNCIYRVTKSGKRLEWACNDFSGTQRFEFPKQFKGLWCPYCQTKTTYYKARKYFVCQKCGGRKTHSELIDGTWKPKRKKAKLRRNLE